MNALQRQRQGRSGENPVSLCRRLASSGTNIHSMASSLDAGVIGSGLNGMAAAIVLAQAGLSVQVIEAKGTIGGGARSAELTEPGFIHDVCSAVHPLAIASPFFRTLPLHRFGLEWIQPDIPLA